MRICTFFGSRNASPVIRPMLRKAIIDLIDGDVTKFYAGNNGSFDLMVIDILNELKNIYPQLRYEIVLAYLPQGKNKAEYSGYTVFPEELEKVPRRYAISRRNDWMLKHSDCVISYCSDGRGNSYKMAEKAVKQKKTVISLPLS